MGRRAQSPGSLRPDTGMSPQTQCVLQNPGSSQGPCGRKGHSFKHYLSKDVSFSCAKVGLSQIEGIRHLLFRCEGFSSRAVSAKDPNFDEIPLTAFWKLHLPVLTVDFFPLSGASMPPCCGCLRSKLSTCCLS